MSTPPHPLRDYTLLFILALIWGGAFALIKIAVGSVPPVTVAAIRIALAAMILYMIVRASGEILPRPTTQAGWRIWAHFLAVGMLGNGIPFTLVSWGETEMTSSLAAILMGVMPIFTVALARLTGAEAQASPKRIGGVVLGFAALVVLMGPAAFGEIGGQTLVAQVAVAAAAACYAATAVYIKHLSLRVPTLTLAAGTMIACAFVMVPAALIIDAPWRMQPTPGAVAAIAALAIFPTALASIGYFRLLVAAGPTFASMINYLIPAFGALVGVLWLDETLGTAEVAALTLILAAIALVRNPVPPPSR